MRPISSMTPEEQEQYAREFRARAGIGVPALAGGAGMAAMGVPGVNAALGTAMGLMPTAMGDQEQDPIYRQLIQDQARTNFQDRGFQPPMQPSGGGMSSLAQLLQGLMGR